MSVCDNTDKQLINRLIKMLEKLQQDTDKPLRKYSRITEGKDKDENSNDKTT